MLNSAVDQILAALSVDVREFAVCEFVAGSAIDIRALDEIEVHFVLLGTLFLGLDDGECLKVPAGGVVLVPPGVSQRMGGSPSPQHVFDPADTCRVRPDGLMHYDATMGGSGSVLVACGQIKADIAGSFGPFDGLRASICSQLGSKPLVRFAFETMLEETHNTALGSRGLLGSLMKSCLILALRHYADENGSHRALPGLFDRPSLARAVASVVENPAAVHTLEDLARTAGMSRSKFAKVFADTMAVTPMEFVARTRLDQARNLLMSTALPVSAVAARVGFGSRSHFSRAFRGRFGLDPSSLRKNGGAA